MPRNFDLGDKKVYLHFKENKYHIFDLGLSGANAGLLNNLIPNPERHTTGSFVL